MKTVLNTCFNKYIVNFWIDEEGNETTMNKTIQSPYLTDTEKRVQYQYLHSIIDVTQQAFLIYRMRVVNK